MFNIEEGDVRMFSSVAQPPFSHTAREGLKNDMHGDSTRNPYLVAPLVPAERYIQLNISD